MGFPFVGEEEGLKSSIIRARVFEGKPKHQNYHGWWSGSGITGKFLREKSLSQIIINFFWITVYKREKVFFQSSENTTRIKGEFSGCYRPSPLKRISSSRLRRLYKIILERSIYTPFKNFFRKTLEFNTQEINTPQDFY